MTFVTAFNPINSSNWSSNQSLVDNDYVCDGLFANFNISNDSFRDCYLDGNLFYMKRRV